MNDIKKSNSGHRGRLREKFLCSGLDGFLDYEIIELLLTLGTPRKDCKQLAKNLITEFGSLKTVLDASINDLQRINGVGPSNAFGIKLFQAISEQYFKAKIDQNILLDSPMKIFEFLKFKIGTEKKEHFVILYFDTKNNLIVEDISTGTLNASLVHPREVFSKAILNNASHIVIAHNHPSGDSMPSKEDIDTTKRLIEAGNLLGISVIDHIIITKNNYTSLVESKII